MAITTFYQRAFPTFDLNKHFYLREHILEDTQAFYAYYTDPDVSKYILADAPTNIFEAESEIRYCKNMFQNNTGIYWTIARKEDDQMVGAVGLYINNFHQRAEISYDLSKEYWRQGIVSKAINTVTRYGFETIGLTRIEAITMLDNEASMNLLKKCGYQYEGLLRNYKFYAGKARDVEMFAKTP